MNRLALLLLLLLPACVPADPPPEKTMVVGGWAVDKVRVESEHMTCYVFHGHSSSMTCIPDTVKCAPEQTVAMEPGFCILTDGGVTCYPLKKEER